MPRGYPRLLVALALLLLLRTAAAASGAGAPEESATGVGASLPPPASRGSKPAACAPGRPRLVASWIAGGLARMRHVLGRLRMLGAGGARSLGGRAAEASAVVVIPARFGSTRFPGKPLALINDRPLLAHTLLRAKKARTVQDVVVATDHEGIGKVASEHNATVVFTSTDCPTGTDRVSEALGKLGVRYDIVVNVQGDEALIDPGHIDVLVQHMRSTPQDVMATLCVPIRTYEDWTNRNVVKVVLTADGYALYFSRAPIPAGAEGQLGRSDGQEVAEPPLQHPFRHLGVYAFRTDFLAKYAALPRSSLQALEDLEQLKVLSAGYRIKVVPVLSAGPDVNVPEDVGAVEEWIRARGAE